MSVSMKDLRRVTASQPPRVLIYGPPGMGKTSLAAEFPAPVFLQTEDGVPSGLEVDSFGLLNSFGDVMRAIEQLYVEPHDFKTVVLDSLSEMERLVYAETCLRNKLPDGSAWSSIEAPGYGKGYKAADYVWQELIDGMNALRRERNVAIVLIGHAEIGRFDDPTSQSYSRYDIQLHERSSSILDREVDAIFLLKQEVSLQKEEQGFNKTRNVGVSGATRWIYTEGRPAWIAKNRYGMPDKLIYQRGQGFASLAKYFPQQWLASALAQAA